MPESSPSGNEVLPTVMSPNNNKPTYVVIPPIDNNNIEDEEVILLDISCNKEWISYMTYRKNGDGSYLGTGNGHTGKRCTYLTVRKFTEMDRQQGADNEQQNCHLSIDITGLVEDAGQQHCRFLSVSPNGKYVVLSFCERNLDSQYRIRRSRNPDCLVFEVNNNGINYDCARIKFQGRAVFLWSKKGFGHGLALIDLDTIQVYDNFSASSFNRRPTYWFHINELSSLGTNTKVNIVKDEFYIKNATWMATGDNEPDHYITSLTTYTRHVRQHILTTPIAENGNVFRAWSILKNDGARVASFPTSVDENEHVTAFSKCCKYTASYTKCNRSVDFVKGIADFSINIYNTRSGLLVYKLDSCRQKDCNSSFEVSHIRFCHGVRYLAMAGVKQTRSGDGKCTTKAVFEVWHIEAEESIYYKDAVVGDTGAIRHKTIQPFVARAFTDDQKGNIIKCWKGIYTTLGDSNQNNNRKKTITQSIILDIDENATTENGIQFVWIGLSSPLSNPKFEVNNNLDNHKGLKCGKIKIHDQEYLIRFGKHTVQIWLKDTNKIFNSVDKDNIMSKNDKLVYIRAYKAPSYGTDHSFRETWMVHNFDSIKFINGRTFARVIVNITESNSDDMVYHTEEIFLPLDQLKVDKTASSFNSDKISDDGAYTSANDTCSSSALNVKFTSAPNLCSNILRRETCTETDDLSNALTITRALSLPPDEKASAWANVSDYTSTTDDSANTSQNALPSAVSASMGGSANKEANGLPVISKNINGGTRKRNYFYQLESACQALHYLHTLKNDLMHDINEENLSIIYGETRELVNEAINNIDKESRFFVTVAGSKILAVLASFGDGKDILKQIVAKDAPLSIYSFGRPATVVVSEDDSEEEEYKEQYYVGRTEKDSAAYLASVSKNISETQPRIHYRSSPSIGANRFAFKSSKTIAPNENVLTILLEDEWDYSLYKAFFNRLILDSKKLGPACLSALIDTLLFLQDDDNTELLLSSIEKLSFLEIESKKLGFVSFESYPSMAAITNKGSSLSNLESYAAKEQMKMSGGFVDWWLLKFITTIKKWINIAWLCFYYKFVQEILLGYIIRSKKLQESLCHRRPFRVFKVLSSFIDNLFRNNYSNKKAVSKKLSQICVVPLPHLDSYSNLPDYQFKNRMDNEYGSNILKYMNSDAFVKSALTDEYSNDMFRQGYTIFNVLIDYKWKKFARWRFWLLICSIHVTYYVTYSTGVLFPQELFHYAPGSSYIKNNTHHLVSIVLMIAAGLVLIVQEIRQFYYTQEKIEYFKSGYNWIDILAFVFPLITLLQLIFNWNYLTEVSSITTLILWTHAILRLRVVSFFGVTLEIIIQLSKNVSGLLLILLLVIFAFTNSFIVLLRQQEDGFFQEAYDGTTTSNQSDGGVIAIQDISSSNNFNDVYKSFTRVWFFTYGVWDPINGGNAGDDKMIMALSVLFSLVTILIFFNLIIAVMSSTADEVRKKGNRAWVNHFASVVEEIELLWCFARSKHDKENNPSYLYYFADMGDIKRHERRLIKEMKELQETFGH